MLAMVSLFELLIALFFALGLLALMIGGGIALYAVMRRAARDGARDAARITDDKPRN